MANHKKISSSEEPIASCIHVNGVELSLLDWGGMGEPILILHATGFLGRLYRPIIDRLKGMGRVFTYDQRGQGDSPHKEGTVYNWDNTLLDLEAVINLMGWSKIRAIGHSAGATAIGSLTAKNHGLISRAVLIDPVIFDISARTFNEHPLYERTLKRRKYFDSVDAMFEDFSRIAPFNTWQKDILYDYCKYGTRELEDGRRELKCSPKIEATIYDTGRFFDGLGKILTSTTPLMFLFAEKSTIFAKFAPMIAQTLKNSQVIVTPKHGHLMAMEDPDFVAEHAISFFNESIAKR